MKHIILIALLTGITLGAGAQVNKQMTKEEREKTIYELNKFYELECGKYFTGRSSQLREIKTIPWEEWEPREQVNRFLYYQKPDSIHIQAAADDPMSCRITLGDLESTSESTTTYLSPNFLTDNQGNRTGVFQGKSKFYDLGIRIELHLADRNGKPVFIKPEGQAWVTYGRSNSFLSLELPLTCPFNEIADGYIDLRLSRQTEYLWTEVTTADIGKDSRLGNTPFRLEKIDDVGFVISGSREDARKLYEDLEYLYRRDGKIWKQGNTFKQMGNLANLLRIDPKSDLTFEEWLAKKHIDLDRLYETIENLEEHLEDGREQLRGIRIESGMAGDAILLYTKTDSARNIPFLFARIFPASTGKPAEMFRNEDLTFAMKETPLHTDLQSRTSESAILPEPGKNVDDIPAISYGASVSMVLSFFRNMDLDTFQKEYAPLIREGYKRAKSSTYEELERTRKTLDRKKGNCFIAGSNLAAYHTDVEFIIRATTDILRLSSETDPELFNHWLYKWVAYYESWLNKKIDEENNRMWGR